MALDFGLVANVTEPAKLLRFLELIHAGVEFETAFTAVYGADAS